MKVMNLCDETKPFGNEIDEIPDDFALSFNEKIKNHG